jgi:hypothetical protein
VCLALLATGLPLWSPPSLASPPAERAEPPAPTTRPAPTDEARTPDAGSIAPESASELLARFRKSPGLEARFVEVKQMALLAVPLESSGTLFYSPPGLLARHIVKPAESAVVIEPGRVRIWDGVGWEAIDLSAQPVVRRFVDSFVVLLAGDEESLRRRYEAQYAVERNAEGRPSGWRLVLRPRFAPLNKVVKLLELHGRGLRVSRMRMVELDGDETTTTFSAINPARRFTAEEKTRIFHLEAR